MIHWRTSVQSHRSNDKLALFFVPSIHVSPIRLGPVLNGSGQHSASVHEKVSRINLCPRPNFQVGEIFQTLLCEDGLLLIAMVRKPYEHWHYFGFFNLLLEIVA